jgi:hypothetical protein
MHENDCHRSKVSCWSGQERAKFSRAQPELFCVDPIGGWEPREGRQMWNHLQMWLPLLSISLAASIGLGVAALVVGQEKINS